MTAQADSERQGVTPVPTITPTTQRLAEQYAWLQQNPPTPEEQAAIDAVDVEIAQDIAELHAQYERMLADDPALAERIRTGPSMVDVLTEERDEE
ncbi:MAG TPA: hypothetical protein VMV29_21025 [Ktedonobacterales bacterium]|nr:hypothetical protein [Ktedonobacterales bacterium]